MGYKRLPGISIAGLVALLAACSSSATVAPPPTPLPCLGAGGCPCTEPNVPGPQLAYPEPGASNVPVAAGTFVFYGSLSSSYAASLLAADGETIPLGTFTSPPSPLPSPSPRRLRSGNRCTVYRIRR